MTNDCKSNYGKKKYSYCRASRVKKAIHKIKIFFLKPSIIKKKT